MQLLFSDPHFNDKESDKHRFGIFPWLAEQAKKHNIQAIFCLGDLTDAKDKHSSQLVNAIVDGFRSLPPPVYILKGNHDYISEGMPFFKFLDTIEGLHFVTETTQVGEFTMIPHQSDQAAFDRACSLIQGQGAMLHQTISGAIGELGTRLNGLGASLIAAKNLARCYSGDIHRPQVCGPVTYVGSPWHVRFGDDFRPRVLLLGNEETDLTFPAPRKQNLLITCPEDLFRNKGLAKGDQVKIALELTREEVPEWPKHKQCVYDVCKELGLEVHGLEMKVVGSVASVERVKLKTDEEVFDSFCAAENVPAQTKRIGQNLMR